jgi:hypothetical protein
MGRWGEEMGWEEGGEGPRGKGGEREGGIRKGGKTKKMGEDIRESMRKNGKKELRVGRERE